MATAPSILITSGNIGDAAIAALAKKGTPVRATVRTKKPNAEWDKAGVEQAEFDYAKPETMKRAFDGIDTWFFVSPFVENLVDTALAAIDQAKAAGVNTIVRSSALGAGPDAITIGRWHWQVEQALEKSGMQWTILQPNTFMQYFLGFADTIKSQGAFYAPLDEGRVSYVDVRDVGRCAAAVLSSSGHAGKRYAITGPESVSPTDGAKTISAEIGKPVQYVPVSDDAARQAMAGMGLPGWMVEAIIELQQITRKGWVGDVSTDAEKLLGRKPTTLKEFVHEFRGAFV